MPQKPRPLGNNAADAVEDIDELLEDTQRILVGALTSALKGDINATGTSIAQAIDNNALAGRIAVLTRAGEFDRAARVWPEAQQRRGLQP
jgi:hypothetical protein